MIGSQQATKTLQLTEQGANIEAPLIFVISEGFNPAIFSLFNAIFFDNFFLFMVTTPSVDYTIKISTIAKKKFFLCIHILKKHLEPVKILSKNSLEENMMTKLVANEVKRNISKTSFLVLALFILSCLFLNHAGLKKVKRSESTKLEFIQNETRKVETYFNYTQYCWAGFKMLFFSAPIEATCNQYLVNDLQFTGDTNYRFDFSNPQKGENVFKRSVGLPWFMYVIGGGLVLYIAWNSFRNREYIRQLLNVDSKKTVVGSILAARAILLFLSVAILTACLFLQYLIMGVKLKGLETSFIGFMLLTYGVMLVLLLVGSALGTIRNLKRSIAVTIIFWLILLLLWPHFYGLIFSEKAADSMKSIYRIEAEKVKAINEFEKEVLEYIQDKEDKIKAAKEYTDKFLNDGIIEKLDREIINETFKNTKKYQLWSIIIPFTFLESAGNEIGGSGYNEQERFAGKCLELKKEFTRYCLEKRFQYQSGKVEPFLKGNEYIFYAKPSLPAYFIYGILVTIFYVFVLLCVSYYRFYKYVEGFSKKEKLELKKREIKLEMSKILSLCTSKIEAKNMIYSYFSDYKRIPPDKIPFTLEGIDIDKIRADTYYIGHLDTIPGNLKVKDLFNYLSQTPGLNEKEIKKAYDRLKIGKIGNKHFADIAFEDKFRIMLFPAVIKKSRILFFNELDTDLIEKDYLFLIEEMSVLKEDRFLIYVSKNLFFAGKIHDNLSIPFTEEFTHILQ